MEHKLFVEIDYDVLEKKLKKFLNYEEFITGSKVSFKFSVKNLGDKNFSGGKLTDIELSFKEGGGVVFRTTHKPDQSPEIPNLRPGEKKYVFEWTSQIKNGGIVFLLCKIKANDNNLVRYYQTDSLNIDLGTERWYDVYCSIERTNLLLLDELAKLRKDIKRIK